MRPPVRYGEGSDGPFPLPAYHLSFAMILAASMTLSARTMLYGRARRKPGH